MTTVGEPASEPSIELTRWSGPWPADDPDANLKADVALYANTDPLRTLRGLSTATGIPIGALVRYVLGRWASEGASGLLELGPTMTRRLDDVCRAAQSVGTDETRLAAFDQLSQMISWLVHPLDNPDVYEEPIDRVRRARGLNGPDEARSFYDRWAVNYDDDVYGALGFTGTDTLVRRAVEALPPSSVVLDAGCGTGAVGERLATFGFQTVDGLDLSSKMLKIAEHKHVYRRLIHADLLAELPLTSQSYDAVVSAGTFVTGHVDASALDELARVLRPGGVLVATVLDALWEHGGFAAAVENMGADAPMELVACDMTEATSEMPSAVRLIVLRRNL